MPRNLVERPKIRRECSFQLRLTKEERHEIYVCADALGLADSAYLLMCHKLHMQKLINKGFFEREDSAQGQKEAV